MNILEILTPTHYFTHQTSLSAQEVRTKIHNNLTPKDAKLPIFSLTNKRESYEGEILENGFEISRRKKGGKNSFPAVVSGSITENQNGSKLVVEIKHPTYMKILILSTFILLVIDIILAIVFRLIPLSEELIYLTTFFGVAFSFGFFVHFFNAKSEAKALKKKLIEFVEGKNSK